MFIDVLPLRDLYTAVDWPVIVLLGALIPVGGALETSGATALLAGAIVSVTAALPVFGILALVLVGAMFLSDVISNAATAVIMAPIAFGVATTPAGERGRFPDGGGGGRLLCVPDTDRASVEHPGHGPGRLPLR